MSHLCRMYMGGQALSELMKRQRPPLNYASLSGELYALEKQIGAQFESPLARDYMMRLEFDDKVLSFFPKPITICYEFERKLQGFRPAVLVRFCPTASGKAPCPSLVDIRTERDVQLNPEAHRARVDAAINACERRGWQFQVLTEKEIRTPFLSNARFFIPFRRYEAIEPEYSLLRRAIGRGYFSPLDLMTKVAAKIDADPAMCARVPNNADERRARLQSMIWRLVAKGLLKADFHAAKVDEATRMWNAFFSGPAER